VVHSAMPQMDMLWSYSMSMPIKMNERVSGTARKQKHGSRALPTFSSLSSLEGIIDRACATVMHFTSARQQITGFSGQFIWDEGQQSADWYDIHCSRQRTRWPSSLALFNRTVLIP
jgi:hypothetical protein